MVGRGGQKRSSAAALVALVMLVSCVQHQPVTPPPSPVAPAPPERFGVAEIARMIPSRIPDREGWARDLLASLKAHDLRPTLQNVASILAVIEQESGFQANPTVPGLAKLVEKQLNDYASKLGPLGPPTVRALLEARVPGTPTTFRTRLQQARTERDLDRLFRELLRYYETGFPKTFAAANLLGGLISSTRLEDFNPITTAGCMQVSVRFAHEQAKKEGKSLLEVRDALYTRRGGLHYGVARLLGYDAGYKLPLYRFADYNAGLYASRNAALQDQLARLTGLELVPDGDLLAYNRQGDPLPDETRSLHAMLAFREKYAPTLSEAQLRRDVQKEKTLSLEHTDTWRALKAAYERVTGQHPSYARLPEVTLRSPKLSAERSTAWFARSVDKRYQALLQRKRTPKS